MAIAYDAEYGSFTNSSSGSLTYSHTCTGSDLVLYVMAATASGVTVTGITYNGVSMTLVDSYTGIGLATDNVYLYILVGPSTGANNIVISASGSGSLIYAGSSSYTGAAQSGQPVHTAKNSTASATSLTTTVDTSSAPSTDNCWVIGGYLMDGNFTASAGANTTLRTTAVTKDWVGMMDSNAAVTPPGSRSLIFNSSSASVMRGIITSLAPFTAAGPANLKSLDTNLKANIKSYNTNVLANIKSINTNA